MPSFNVSVPHNLGQEAAKARVHNFLEQVRTRYQEQMADAEGAWNDNVLSFSFKTYGFKIRGALDVQPQVVHVTGELPLAAILFKGQAEKAIRTELERELS